MSVIAGALKDLSVLARKRKVPANVLRSARFISDALKTCVDSVSRDQPIDQLDVQCRSLSQLYRALPEGGIKFAGILFNHIASTKLGTALIHNKETVKTWEAILVALLIGILEYLDENPSHACQALIASTFYSLVCTELFFPRRDSATAILGSKLRQLVRASNHFIYIHVPHEHPTTTQLRYAGLQTYDMLSSTANLHIKNKEVLRDPSLLGSERIGMTLSITKDLASLEELLNLIAVLIPDTEKTPDRRQERSNFIRNIFLSARRLSPEKEQPLVSLLEKLTNKNWITISTQLLTEFAAMDISFPQPFPTSSLQVCGRNFHATQIYIDSECISAVTLIDGEEDRKLKIPLDSMLPPFSSREHDHIRIKTTLTGPPSLGLEGITSSPETWTLSFAITTDDEARFADVLSSRGLTVTKETQGLRVSVSNTPLPPWDPDLTSEGMRLPSKLSMYASYTKTYDDMPSETFHHTSGDDAVFNEFINFSSEVGPPSAPPLPSGSGKSFIDKHKKPSSRSLSALFGEHDDSLSDISDYSDEKQSKPRMNEEIQANGLHFPQTVPTVPEGHGSETSATAIDSDTRPIRPDLLPLPYILPQAGKTDSSKQHESVASPVHNTRESHKRKHNIGQHLTSDGENGPVPSPKTANKRPRREPRVTKTMAARVKGDDGQLGNEHTKKEALAEHNSIPSATLHLDTLLDATPTSPRPAPTRTSPRTTGALLSPPVKAAPVLRSRITAMKKKTGSNVLSAAAQVAPKAPRPRPRPKKKPAPSPPRPNPPVDWPDTPSPGVLPTLLASGGLPESPDAQSSCHVPPSIPVVPVANTAPSSGSRGNKEPRKIISSIIQDERTTELSTAVKFDEPRQDQAREVERVRADKIKDKAARAKQAKEEKAAILKLENFTKDRAPQEITSVDVEGITQQIMPGSADIIDLDRPLLNDDPYAALQESETGPPDKRINVLGVESEKTRANAPLAKDRSSEAEQRREEKLRKDELCQVLSPHEVKCRCCGNRIKLDKEGRFYTSHWETHRQLCLSKLGGSPTPSSVSDSEVRLRQDALCQIIDPREVKCLRCDNHIKLSYAFAAMDWEKHRQECLLQPVHPSPLPSVLQEEILRQDSLCEVLGPYGVKCLRCDEHITLSKEREFDIKNWSEHREMCLKKPIGYSRCAPVSDAQNVDGRVDTKMEALLSAQFAESHEERPHAPADHTSSTPTRKNIVSSMRSRNSATPAGLLEIPLREAVPPTMTIDLTGDSPLPPSKETPRKENTLSVDLTPESVVGEPIHFQVPESPMSPLRKIIQTSSSSPSLPPPPAPEPRIRPRVTFAPHTNERYFTKDDPRRKLKVSHPQDKGKAKPTFEAGTSSCAHTAGGTTKHALAPSSFRERERDEPSEVTSPTTERFAEVINNIAQAIKHQIRSGLQGVRDQADAARSNILHKAAGDLEVMREENVALFNRLVDVEEEYTRWGQECRKTFFKFQNSAEHTRGVIREVIETHDRNAIAKKMPNSLFSGVAVPPSLCRE